MIERMMKIPCDDNSTARWGIIQSSLQKGNPKSIQEIPDAIAISSYFEMSVDQASGWKLIA